MPRALIIDDDPKILEVLEERLLSMGHDCDKAQSQSEAETILDEKSFDYILLDLEIPTRYQGNADIAYGHNLLRKIRQTPGHSRTPVLAMTAHGLKSYHLCAETMKLGANGFVGKPFGRDNPLEDKIREVIGADGQGGGRAPAASAGLRKFDGGELVYYEDRVELCGIRICGAKGSSAERGVLDALREKHPNGKYRKFSMIKMAEKLRIDRPARVAEAVAKLRALFRTQLRDGASFACDDNDVILNPQNQGYHFRDWITVLDGIDSVEEEAVKRDVTLTKHQKAIIRLLRKHATRTPRQLSDSLSLTAAMVTKEVDALVRAGLAAAIGNGPNRSVQLITAVPAPAGP